MMFTNILSVVILLSWLVGFRVGDPRYKGHLVVLALLLLLSNYLRFMRRGDADDLIRQLARQKRREARRDERLWWLYVVGSLAAPFALGYVHFLIFGRPRP